MKTQSQTLFELGQYLEKARIVRRLTQQELAQRASVTRQTVANIEKGKPSASLVAVIWALGLEQNLLAAVSPAQDEIGRSLAFGSLPKKVGKKNNAKHIVEDDSDEFPE